MNEMVHGLVAGQKVNNYSCIKINITTTMFDNILVVMYKVQHTKLIMWCLVTSLQFRMTNGVCTCISYE